MNIPDFVTIKDNGGTIIIINNKPVLTKEETLQIVRLALNLVVKQD